MMHAQLWPWGALFLLGAWHGINPAMGWLFAVGLGFQDRSAAAVVRAIDDGRPVALVLPNPDLVYPKSERELGFTAGAIALLVEAVLARRFAQHPESIEPNCPGRQQPRQ